MPATSSQRAARWPVATDTRSVGSTSGSRLSVGQQRGERRVGDEALGCGDHVVGALGAVPGGAVGGGGDADRRAVALRRHAAAELDEWLGDAAHPAQGLADDVDAGPALGLDGEVLPAAAAAAGPA